MSFKSILKKSLTSGLLQQKLSAPELIVTLLVTVLFAVYNSCFQTFMPIFRVK